MRSYLMFFPLPAVLACLLLFPAPRAAAQPPIQAEGLREDLAFVLDTIRRVHPDPAFAAGAAERDLGAASGTPAVLTRDEAWRRLALLNPAFADAHLFIGYPDWRADAASHLAAGGGLFPLEVDLDDDDVPRVRAALGGEPGPLDGARILAIDGRPAAEVTRELAQRVHGDTPRFRAALLARRWWFYHWKTAGAQAHYRLDLERAGRRWRVDLPAGRRTPAVLRDDADAARQFSLSIRPGCGALLKAGSFDFAHRDRFLAFTRDAFARLRDEHVGTLLIDVAGNGGGDDSLWIEGLLPYLSTQPWRTGSAYLKRVMEANPARGEAAGQVVAGEIETWHAPQTDQPLHFTGQVFVRIDPATYSSAVLFANVMRDFGFATLAGNGDAARRTQSGGIRRFVLPKSGLVLWVPRFMLAPPKGGPREALLAPADAPRPPACLDDETTPADRGAAGSPGRSVR